MIKILGLVLIIAGIIYLASSGALNRGTNKYSVANTSSTPQRKYAKLLTTLDSMYLIDVKLDGLI